MTNQKDLRRRSALAILVVTLAAAPALGCSFMFVERAPPKPRGQPLSCTSSPAPPLLDSLATMVGIFYTGKAWSGSADAKVIAGGAVTSLALISAIYGISSISDCRELKERERQWDFVTTPRPRTPRAGPPRVVPPPPDPQGTDPE
jgi:hypothetical protein